MTTVIRTLASHAEVAKRPAAKSRLSVTNHAPGLGKSRAVFGKTAIINHGKARPIPMAVKIIIIPDAEAVSAKAIAVPTRAPNKGSLKSLPWRRR